MNTMIAALDATAAARPVLETAVRIGELTGTHVEAVHVADGPIDTPESLAEKRGVPFRLLNGPVGDALVEAIDAPEVVVAVLGARATTGGRRPVGTTTSRVLAVVKKPVVIVPPEALSPRPLRRLLVPLEGTESSSQAASEALAPFLGVDVELVVLHVLTDQTLPRMLDHPLRDMEMFGKEFMTTHFPHASSIELRRGPVGQRVIEVCGEQHADLVALSWSQVRSAGRARVVREVLGASVVPVLLFPSLGRER